LTTNPKGPRMIDVTLVLMPFAALERPSLALGLLKSCLAQAGVAARVEYANLDFAEFSTLDLCQTIVNRSPNFLLGEWVFAQAAFPDYSPDPEIFFATQPHKNDMEELLELRRRVPEFVDGLARRILEDRPRLVGCSSVFQQHCPSLALLRRIRELAPEVITVMGGGNCEGEMGLATHRHFPWVDYVVSGEADRTFPELCQRLLACQEAGELPGVLTPAHRDQPTTLARPQVLDLNQTPVPNFDEYFARLTGVSYRQRVRPGLPVETSRGCWWGQKHHCTFCGLNGSGMTYRSKTPERVLAEFAELSERYQLRSFEPVDNILDMSYLDSVLPQLATEDPPYRLFYETKANLRYPQLQNMAAAGVRWIQPGIESLHDEVLKLIDKGTTGLVNIQLLKWARELGIRLSWNFLFDFPGEQESWYREMLSWLPLLTHLQPPTGAYPVRFDRFSPYHVNSGKYGLELRPMPAYAQVYPLPEEELQELAYYFVDPRRQWNEAHRELIRFCQLWFRSYWTMPALLSLSDNGKVLDILDTRQCAVARRQQLEGLEREVYLACDKAAPLKSLRSQFGDQVESILAYQVERKLTLVINGRYLALGVRGSLPSLKMPCPGGDILAARRVAHA
jgi:ribosomal peptide maturation radical SAM protein 1